MRFATADDKAAIEAVVNHPELRKFNAHDGAPPCDAEKYLKAPSFAVLVDGGCFLAHCVGPCRYSVHTNFLPECRGRHAIRVAGDAMDFAFSRTDCEELYAMVPANNPQADWFTRAMGMRFRFKRERVWRQDGVDHDMHYYSIAVDDWVLRGSCTEHGRLFHKMLHVKAPQLEQHADDPVHDAYVGAAFALFDGGQKVKAVSLFNRWARLAGYVPIKVISKDPLSVDIGNAILEFKDGGDFAAKEK